MNEEKTFGIESKEGTLKDYFCLYCGYKFKHWVRTVSGNGKHNLTTQIMCPQCKNFLTTK